MDILSDEKMFLCSLISKYCFEDVKDVIMETANATREDVYKWGNEECFEHPYTSDEPDEEFNRKRHRCPECWEEFTEVKK